MIEFTYCLVVYKKQAGGNDKSLYFGFGWILIINTV